jgi:phospholipase C
MPQAAAIEHLFVLMLENRSFDHMLGFSGITGTDAVTGTATSINGLTGTESNTFNGKTFTVHRGASNVMPHDPSHEFPEVLLQLCGPGAVYPPGAAYPPVNNSGYAASYAVTAPQADPNDVMRCYTPGQLPVLNALAREFVVCDIWCASMPGATWPNRLFVHAASSGGLDHSPTNLEIAQWELLPGGGVPLLNGHLFDSLDRHGVKRRIYAGDDFPMIAALKGIGLFDVREYQNFARDLRSTPFDFRYIFLEPSYDVFNDYRNGTSQHPLGDVTRGEALIKATYEAIRNSPVWERSMLIITWDEHGGFYDHAVSDAAAHAVAPGDTTPGSARNQFGFTFEHLGPRVPAVVISPLVPRNLIDHRIYDHSSIPATVEHVFGLPAMTHRDAAANGLNTLATLPAARTDAPKTLPSPPAQPMSFAVSAAPIGGVTRPAEPANDGNVPAIVNSAMRQDIQVSPPDQCPAIVARVQSIKTRAEAMEYVKEVQAKVRPRRATHSAVSR